jgi:hypothetical protein
MDCVYKLFKVLYIILYLVFTKYKVHCVCVWERERCYVTAIIKEEKIIFNMLLCQGVKQTIIKLWLLFVVGVKMLQNYFIIQTLCVVCCVHVV